MTIVQIVRRYGPVGGMERYVWELTRELAGLGHRLLVICELVCGGAVDARVDVVTHACPIARPRWLAHLYFSRQVSRWLAARRQADWIVHSHERSQGHTLTTFHAPPFARVREDPIWKRMSLRVAASLWLERREILNPTVRAVVPCSDLIGQRLGRYYPECRSILAKAIPPGVPPLPERPRRHIPSDGGTVGFIGYEWKRKGLDRAIQVADKLLETRPNLEFLVAGPEPRMLKTLFSAYRGRVTFLGNTRADTFYPRLDLLLHPARFEPYGMVVAEAMAARVPVVISAECGARSLVTPLHGRVLSVERPVEEWVEACSEMLARVDQSPGYGRPWKEVAEEYASLYKSVA